MVSQKVFKPGLKDRPHLTQGRGLREDWSLFGPRALLGGCHQCSKEEWNMRMMRVMIREKEEGKAARFHWKQTFPYHNFPMVAPNLLFISGLSKWVVLISLCSFCASALNSKTYMATTLLHLNAVCMASVTCLPPTQQDSEAQGLGPAGCAILCQACDKQTQVALHLVPGADFTPNLKVSSITLGIYPPGVIKSILFQTVAVLFQEEQLEIQIPLFQNDFSPAGKLRDGRCKSKFP